MPQMPLDLDGYTDLPAGKIAFVVTFLEMLERPSSSQTAQRHDVELVPWEKPDPKGYKALFRQIGEDWLWFGRLTAEDADLANLLEEPGRELFLPQVDGEPVGLLEIDYTDKSNPELAYFGLVPGAVGTGLGRWLMGQAVDMVWSRPETKRFWVHTCTGDSPQALGFYRASGFQPYKLAIEVADDPRAAGLLPTDKGPHVPFLAK